MPKRKGPNTLLLIAAEEAESEELAKEQQTRHRHREHTPGNRKIYTALGVLDRVGHREGQAKYHDGQLKNVLSCVQSTFKLVGRDLTIVRKASNAAPFKKRPEVVSKHLRRIHDRRRRVNRSVV